MREKRNSSQAKFGETTKVIRLPETLANFLQQYPSVVNELVSQIKDGGLSLNVDVTALQPVTANYAFDFDGKFNVAIAPLLARIEALENSRSEASAPANFTQVLISECDESSAAQVEGSCIESLPSFENVAAPSIEKFLDTNALSDKIAATAKPKSTKRSAKAKAILSRPEALAIAQNFGFNGTGQKLYDWSKAALTGKTDESRLANAQKLADVGLIAVLSAQNTPAWQAKS